MNPVYSDWKPFIDGHNRKALLYCPFCERSVAMLEHRYATNRDEETVRQYRVECPICKNNGKVYQNKNVAEKSWEAREQQKPEPGAKPERRRRH